MSNTILVTLKKKKFVSYLHCLVHHIFGYLDELRFTNRQLVPHLNRDTFKHIMTTLQVDARQGHYSFFDP